MAAKTPEKVYVEATTAAGQAVSAVADVIFGTEVYDSHSAFNHSTGIFTAPMPGLYTISIALQTDAVALGTNQRFVALAVATSRTRQLLRVSGSGASEQVGAVGTITMYLAQDETVKIQAGSEVATTLAADATVNWLTIASQN